MVSQRAAIYLGAASPLRSRDYQEHDEQPFLRHSRKRSHSNLAPGGVYRAYRLPDTPVSSYLAFPALPRIGAAVYLCCTVPGVASARRYLAPCPVKPGLSSPAAFRLMRQRPFVLLKPAILSLPSTARAVNHRCLRSRPQFLLLFGRGHSLRFCSVAGCKTFGVTVQCLHSYRQKSMKIAFGNGIFAYNRHAFLRSAQ